MKRHLILIIVLISNSSLKISSQVYHPLLENFKLWDVFYQLNLIDNPECQIVNYCGGDRYFIDGDSVINSYGYSIVKKRAFYTLQPTPFLPPFGLNINEQIVGLIREDTILQKVYFKYFQAIPDTEILIYDFNLQIGDSITYSSGQTARLDSIINIEIINGEIRRKFYFSFSQSEDISFYIEGVGGDKSFLYPIGYCFEGCSTLVCVKKYSEQLYASDYAGQNTCDFITNINIINKNSKINITYNSKLSKLTVTNINNQYQNILKIIDLTGKVICQENMKLSGDSYEFYVDNLKTNGIYFCEIINQKSQFSKKFVIE